MARKYELGLRYFSHDTDMATDRNIRRLTKKFGAAGYGVFMRILECIYKEGHYIKCTDEFIFDISDALNMDDGDEEYVKQVIVYCLKIGLFDSGLFESDRIITSHGIQTRYFLAKEASIIRAKGKDNAPVYDHLLVDFEGLFGKAEQPVEPQKDEVLHFEEDAEEHKPKKRKNPVEGLTEAQINFDKFMKDKYPRICRMDKPLKLEEYENIKDKFGTPILNAVMEKLENHKKLLTNYVSANRTIIEWCKTETTYQNGRTTTIQPTRTSAAEQLAAISRNRRQGSEVPD